MEALMRSIAAALLLLVVGASAAPAANPARTVEDAVVSVLTQPERVVTEVQDPAPENATATTEGSSVHQPSAPDPAPEPEWPDVCTDPTADVMLEPGTCGDLEDWLNDPVADLPLPSIESQIADCTAQTGNPVGCEEKIRYGIVD